MSRIPKEVAAAVMARTDGRCQAHVSDLSMYWRPMAFHHRQARAMGGSKGRDQDTAENLLYVHQSCHEYIHAHPEWSREHGYIVSQYQATPS